MSQPTKRSSATVERPTSGTPARDVCFRFGVGCCCPTNNVKGQVCCARRSAMLVSLADDVSPHPAAGPRGACRPATALRESPLSCRPPELAKQLHTRAHMRFRVERVIELRGDVTVFVRTLDEGDFILSETPKLRNSETPKLRNSATWWRRDSTPGFATPCVDRRRQAGSDDFRISARHRERPSPTVRRPDS